MKSAYYDANYVFKLQCSEAGSAEVCRHAATLDVIYSAQHGRAEIASAAFRKVREGAATPAQYLTFLAQVRADHAMGYLQWLPLSDSIIDRVEGVFSTAPTNSYLRAADALHLASAAEHGFTEIHSNDGHLLAAAPLFGLVDVNVIP